VQCENSARAEEGAKAMNTIHCWVAVIQHRHGHDTQVAATEQELQDKLDDYVKQNWDDELPSTLMPEDQGQRIDKYFEEMAEREESYEIEGPFALRSVKLEPANRLD
jgi:hypothetical protein